MAVRDDLDLVVVGADGSWQSHKAVRAATRAAVRKDAALLLLTVASGEGMPSALADVRRFELGAMESARVTSAHAAMVARETDENIPVEVAVLASLEDPGLADIIERARLLVLGDHGRRGQVAFSIGSMSGDLARCFQVPILLPRLDGVLTQQPSDRHAEVHVGLSGRGDETDLLRLGAEEAIERGCSLRVIRVVRTPHQGQQLRHEQEETWRAVRSVAECDDVPCHVEVVQDDPVAALLARCGPEDVLIVGTRGGGTLAGLIHASVARGVLDGLPCEVIVVPPGARVGRRSPVR